MEEDTQKCPPSCIKPPQCPLVHISFRFGRCHSTFPIFHISIFHITTSPRRHVPTRTMKWLVACTRTLASILVPATRHGKSACSHLFCFCAISLPHTPPFHRIRHSQYMRVGQIMLRYRTFRMPNCFGHWRGIPSCILSPPGLPCVSYACGSCPYRAFVFFSHIVPAFGVLRGTLNIL